MPHPLGLDEVMSLAPSQSWQTARSQCDPTLLLTLLAGLVFATETEAGIGPENVFVVVNASSPNSLAVANKFIELRKIPPSNVIYLAKVTVNASTIMNRPTPRDFERRSSCR